ncbi:MAG: radical SAM protein [Proteobacteria bacterium]|nr:radical SAM protein [Pseudomonadota bacterium]
MNKLRSVDSMKERSYSTYHPVEDVFVPFPPFPKSMLVEVTNACNHACIFCANSKMTRKKGAIGRQLLLSVLAQAYELGTREVGFYSTGEPFLYKDLEWALREAKKVGYQYIYLTSNGALANLERMKVLIASGLDSIKLSINAASRAIYKSVHNRDDFDKVIKNLANIKEYRDREGVTLAIYVTYVITDKNAEEVELAREILGPKCDELLFFQEGNQGGYMSHRGNPAGANLPCSLLFNRFHVTCEGYYTMCCVDYQNYLAVEDLNDVSVLDAWNSNIAVGMRKRHLASSVADTLCANCVECATREVAPLVPHLATKYTF